LQARLDHEVSQQVGALSRKLKELKRYRSELQTRKAGRASPQEKVELDAITADLGHVSTDLNVLQKLKEGVALSDKDKQRLAGFDVELAAVYTDLGAMQEATLDALRAVVEERAQRFKELKAQKRDGNLSPEGMAAVAAEMQGIKDKGRLQAAQRELIDKCEAGAPLDETEQALLQAHARTVEISTKRNTGNKTQQAMLAAKLQARRVAQGKVSEHERQLTVDNEALLARIKQTEATLADHRAAQEAAYTSNVDGEGAVTSLFAHVERDNQAVREREEEERAEKMEALQKKLAKKRAKKKNKGTPQRLPTGHKLAPMGSQAAL
jgi:hypothetical protein